MYFWRYYICIYIFMDINYGTKSYLKFSDLIPFLSSYNRMCQIPVDSVCCFVIIKPILGNCYGPGGSSRVTQGTYTNDPSLERWHPSSPCSPLDNLGCQDPHSPSWLCRGLYWSPLFLFEWTHNWYVDNQGLVPWQFCCLCRSKVRSAWQVTKVRVLSDSNMSWDPRSQLSWNHPRPNTKAKTWLLNNQKWPKPTSTGNRLK